MVTFHKLGLFIYFYFWYSVFDQETNKRTTILTQQSGQFNTNTTDTMI